MWLLHQRNKRKQGQAAAISPTPTQPQHQVQSALLLDVVVGQCATVLQLLASEDQTLLLRRDALLVLDLRLHILNGIRRLHIKCDSLASEGLHEDLHGYAEMIGAVVVFCCASGKGVGAEGSAMT